MKVLGARQPHARPTMLTELGIERLCAGCGEWWPQDEEFWYYQRGRVLGRCRGCWGDCEAAAPAAGKGGRGLKSSGTTSEGASWDAAVHAGAIAGQGAGVRLHSDRCKHE